MQLIEAQHLAENERKPPKKASRFNLHIKMKEPNE